MAPIERKPLPPPNANVTTLTEGDRAEFLARANEVINHHLSGPRCRRLAHALASTHPLPVILLLAHCERHCLL